MNSEYKNMADILQESEIGDFKLQKFTITDNDWYAHIRCGISNGTYIQLRKAGESLMSNTDMEERTNYRFVNRAHGKVLVGGLGIGMIILAIQDNPEVEEITVIEKYQEVIDLVGRQLPLNEKVKIINADVFGWKPPKGEKYNCIYMDIWPYINEDVYKKEMVPLTRKYSRYLVPLSDDEMRFNDCWCKYQAKRGLRI